MFRDLATFVASMALVGALAFSVVYAVVPDDRAMAFEGVYLIHGKSLEDKGYDGFAVVEKTGPSTVMISWEFDEQGLASVAYGIVDGDVVSYFFQLSAGYGVGQLKRHGEKWEGLWSPLQSGAIAEESFTPTSKTAEELRKVFATHGAVL